LPELIVQLRIARSSYFHHRASTCLVDKYAAVRLSLAEIFEANRLCYGYRRLQASLARQSEIISEKGCPALDEAGATGRCRIVSPAFRVVPGRNRKAPDNLINRDFDAKAPNMKWLTDITGFQLLGCKVCLSHTIYCFNGMD